MSSTLTLNSMLRDSLLKMNGTRFELAASELISLKTEAAAGIRPGSFVRVLDCFALLLKGKPVTIDSARLETQDWDDVSAVGAVAPLVGPGRFFAQCGWFHRVNWIWLVMPKILEVKVKRDNRFRDGEPMLWLKTPLGEYALLLPHKHFASQWRNSLPSFGDAARACAFRRWPVDGPRPSWWPQDADDQWPTSTEPPSPSKRLAPTSLEHLEALSLKDSHKRIRKAGESEGGMSGSGTNESQGVSGRSKRTAVATVLSNWDPRLAVSTSSNRR
ncbi:hypothetical protein FS749_002886 [Ceratobasidium sp. UAMH 11750]|nr:hypothetical protein FS749_002886 [Ceratobasidium sp. UAMH 11750]